VSSLYFVVNYLHEILWDDCDIFHFLELCYSYYRTFQRSMFKSSKVQSSNIPLSPESGFARHSISMPEQRSLQHKQFRFAGHVVPDVQVAIYSL
jgi:hypothetical protein